MSSSTTNYLHFAAGVYLSDTPPPSRYTLYTYMYLFTQGREGERNSHREGRGREPERRLEGQQFTELGRKYQHD
jgi:hypothetical protein